MKKPAPKAKTPKSVAKTSQRKGASRVTPMASSVVPALPPDSPTPAFKVGTPVTHRAFGPGVVVAVDSDKLEIDFKTVGMKWIVDSFVKAK